MSLFDTNLTCPEICLTISINCFDLGIGKQGLAFRQGGLWKGKGKVGRTTWGNSGIYV
jgi:hypothetical protein